MEEESGRIIVSVTKTSIRFSSSDAKDDWTETALDSEKCP
jgi:hypothetical protein